MVSKQTLYNRQQSVKRLLHALGDAPVTARYNETAHEFEIVWTHERTNPRECLYAGRFEVVLAFARGFMRAYVIYHQESQ